MISSSPKTLAGILGLCGSAALAAALATPAQAAPARAPASAFVRSASIPAGDDSWDFATWDAATHRLLVAHGNDVLVVDPDARQPVKAIGKIAYAHGVLPIPGTNSLLVSSKKDASARILDASTGEQIANIAIGEDPDAELISPDGHTGYVMDAAGGAVSVIDLVTYKETARIPVKPGLEVAVEYAPGKIAVNNEDENEIELVDTQAGRMSGIIALPGCTGPTGLALDPSTGLALSACANGKASLVDTHTGKQVALLSIGLGPDTAIWDGQHKRFIVPCGKSGTVSVIALKGRKAMPASTSKSETSARTGAYDPTTGRLFLPAASFTPATNGGRGTIVPGSFHILVMAPASHHG